MSGRQVLVGGAGAAGLSAAIGAARAGAEVTLVDPRSRIGGTVTHALIHTIGGLYDGAGEACGGALSRELRDRLRAKGASERRIGRAHVLTVAPDGYGEVVATWLREEPRIAVHLDRTIAAVRRRGEDYEVDVRESSGGSGVVRVDAVVDCTGDAALVRLLDPSLVDDRDPRAAGGLIAILDGLAAGALEFPRGVEAVRRIHRAAGEGRLPPVCATAFLDRGPDDGEACLKLAITGADAAAQAERGARARAAFDPLVDLLRAEMPGFSAARLARVGCVGIRDGGGILGEHRLTVEDVRGGRRFPDAVGRCAWPIEYWNPEGGVTFEYLARGISYDLPLGALKVRGVADLWAAGRCLSAEPLARASARVVGACWTMGEGAGAAAAGAIAAGARAAGR